MIYLLQVHFYSDFIITFRFGKLLTIYYKGTVQNSGLVQILTHEEVERELPVLSAWWQGEEEPLEVPSLGHLELFKKVSNQFCICDLFLFHLKILSVMRIRLLASYKFLSVDLLTINLLEQLSKILRSYF